MAEIPLKLKTIWDGRAANQGIGKLKTQAQGLQKAMGAALGAFVTLEAVKGMGRLSDATFNYQNALKGLETQMRGTGQSADQLLTSLQAVSEGQVAISDLTIASNKAIALLGRGAIPRFAELMEVAAKASSVMGISVTQAFGDIVTGIGRQSRMILDNLGIIVSTTTANEEYATQLGKTADALTDAEKKQAFLNATLDQAKEKYGDLSVEINPMQQLAAATKDLGTALGGLMIDLGIVHGIVGLTSSLRGLADSLNKVDPAVIKGIGASLAALVGIAAAPAVGKKVTEWGKAIGAMMTGLATSFGAFSAKLSVFASKMSELWKVVFGLPNPPGITALAELLNFQGTTLVKVAYQSSKLVQAFKALSVVGKGTVIALFIDLLQSGDELIAGWKDAASIFTDIGTLFSGIFREIGEQWSFVVGRIREELIGLAEYFGIPKGALEKLGQAFIWVKVLVIAFFSPIQTLISLFTIIVDWVGLWIAYFGDLVNGTNTLIDAQNRLDTVVDNLAVRLGFMSAATAEANAKLRDADAAARAAAGGLNTTTGAVGGLQSALNGFDVSGIVSKLNTLSGAAMRTLSIVSAAAGITVSGDTPGAWSPTTAEGAEALPGIYLSGRAAELMDMGYSSDEIASILFSEAQSQTQTALRGELGLGPTVSGGGGGGGGGGADPSKPSSGGGGRPAELTEFEQLVFDLNRGFEELRGRVAVATRLNENVNFALEERVGLLRESIEQLEGMNEIKPLEIAQAKELESMYQRLEYAMEELEIATKATTLAEREREAALQLSTEAKGIFWDTLEEMGVKFSYGMTEVAEEALAILKDFFKENPELLPEDTFKPRKQTPWEEIGISAETWKDKEFPEDIKSVFDTFLENMAKVLSNFIEDWGWKGGSFKEQDPMSMLRSIIEPGADMLAGLIPGLGAFAGPVGSLISGGIGWATNRLIGEDTIDIKQPIDIRIVDIETHLMNFFNFRGMAGATYQSDFRGLFENGMY